MKRIKSIDAYIKGKTLKTITKKWNNLLEATKDEDYLNWVNDCEDLTPACAASDGFYLNFEWIDENVCYVWLVIYE